MERETMETHTNWGLAAISIIIISWIFYRYLLPKSWREWTRAGIVQAFIIAFYAEMYGFPITIYLLTRFFGLDVSGTFWDGNLWVYLFGTPAAMFVSMLIGYAIAIFGIVVLIAAWRELYKARKEGRLAMSGPYAFVRHPQYTGIFLAVFGEGVVHWPTIFSLAAFPIIVIAYALLARKEEHEMIDKFGERYREYQHRVPKFFPKWRDWKHLPGVPSQTHT
jgi:methanethiol S-methyltransferase